MPYALPLGRGAAAKQAASGEQPVWLARSRSARRGRRSKTATPWGEGKAIGAQGRLSVRPNVGELRGEALLLEPAEPPNEASWTLVHPGSHRIHERHPLGDVVHEGATHQLMISSHDEQWELPLQNLGQGRYTFAPNVERVQLETVFGNDPLALQTLRPYGDEGCFTLYPDENGVAWAVFSPLGAQQPQQWYEVIRIPERPTARRRVLGVQSLHVEHVPAGLLVRKPGHTVLLVAYVGEDEGAPRRLCGPLPGFVGERRREEARRKPKKERLTAQPFGQGSDWKPLDL